MIVSYPKYRASGLPFLGDLPEHWTVRPLSGAFQFIGSGTTPNTDSPEFYDGGDIPWVNTGDLNDGNLYDCEKRVAEGAILRHSALKLYPVNSVVIAMYGATIGKLALLKFPATVNQACCAFGGRSEIEPRFLFYTLLALRAHIISLAYGGGQPNISQQALRSLRVPKPTLAEQIAIASFLDRETAKIDALVEEQQRLIGLLKEKRQAVISHAVTKGLDPNVPMKDTGVEWLGEVPQHWTPIQLGRLCRQVSDGPHFSPKYVDEGVMFLSARNVKVDGWSLDDAKFISEEDCAEFDRRVIPERGDILYTKGGTTGIARVVDLDQRFQVWVHIAVLKIDLAATNPYYLAYALNSFACYEQSQLYTQGATNNDLGLTRLIKIWLALPPFDEQGKIATDLKKETERLDELIRVAEQGIELLRARRAALISAAVTGKIDVREKAQRELAVA